MEQNMYVHRLTMQDIVRAASAAYTSGKGPLPEGYKLVKVYDDEVSGFKAVVLEPIDLKKDGKHRIYMVAGTEYSTDGRFDPKDLMAVFSAGVDHLDNDVADRLIADAVKWVLRGGDISAGGHSLGDPVSKVIAYKIELDVRRAILKGEAGPEPRGRVSAEAGLSGFGDKKLRDEMLVEWFGEGAKPDPAITKAIGPVTRHLPGDLVVRFGEHTGMLWEIGSDGPSSDFPTTNEPPNHPDDVDKQPDIVRNHSLAELVRLYDPEGVYPNLPGSSGFGFSPGSSSSSSGAGPGPWNEVKRNRFLDFVIDRSGGGAAAVAMPDPGRPGAAPPVAPSMVAVATVAPATAAVATAAAPPVPAAPPAPFGTDGRLADRRRADDEFHMTADLAGIGNHILEAAEDSGFEPSVRALQGALNRMPAPNLAPLKLDGFFGVKTRQRLQGAVAERGVGPVSDAFAGTLAKTPRPGAPGRRGLV